MKKEKLEKTVEMLRDDENCSCTEIAEKLLKGTPYEVRYAGRISLLQDTFLAIVQDGISVLIRLERLLKEEKTAG